MMIVSHSTNLLSTSLFRPDQLYAVNFDSEETLLHCMQELFASMERIGIDTAEELFMASIDHFSENNLTIYSWEENQHAARGQYGLLSLMILALLNLGLITINYDE